MVSQNTLDWTKKGIGPEESWTRTYPFAMMGRSVGGECGEMRVGRLEPKRPQKQEDVEG